MQQPAKSHMSIFLGGHFTAHHFSIEMDKNGILMPVTIGY